MASSGFSLYKSIIQPIRQVDRDVGNDVLLRYLMGPQAVHDQTESDIQTLFDQIKPSTVRSDILQYLKDIVGFTVDLRHITDRLSEEQLRRLISLAVPMWKERCTRTGLINAVRLLTGRTAVYTDWFGYRFILGEALLGEDQKTSGGDPWIIGGNISAYDEWWSNLRVMDDGTLDELLLLDVVNLERPMSERVEVFIADFLDQFTYELTLWNQTEGTTEPTIVDETMALPANTAVEPIIPLLSTESEHKNYVLVTKFKLTTGGALRVRWYTDPVTGSYFQLDIQLTTPKFTFSVYDGTTLSPLVTTNALIVGLAADTEYKLRIQTHEDGSDRKVRIFIDSNTIIPVSGIGEYTYTPTVGEVPYGTWSFKATGAAAILDNVESWRFIPTARFATIEAGGVVTKTDNFVQ